MFDQYHFPKETTYVDRHITVNEHKAPTDESVKLLNELEEKAIKNIISRFSTSNNILQTFCAVHENGITGYREIFLKMTLNNKDYKLIIEIDPFTMDNIIKQVCDKVSAAIAQEIVNPMLMEYQKNWRIPF